MKVTATSYSYTRIPDSLWRRLRKLIPKHRPSPKGGRPRLDPRRVADGIYFVMRTGCPWKAVPSCFVSGSSLHHYFQQWCNRGVFRKLWKKGLVEYDQRHGIGWRWLTLDTATTKAPLGGEKNRTEPNRSGQAGRQTFDTYRRSRGGAGLRPKMGLFDQFSWGVAPGYGEYGLRPSLDHSRFQLANLEWR